MSVTLEDASLANEFHISPAGLPCEIWTRDGFTHYGPGPGQFRVPVISRDELGFRVYDGITTVNAGDFHTLASCPNVRSDPPPPATCYPVLSLSDRSEDSGRDADGYDSDGYDRDGYDRDGYDRDGYNEDGYNEDGYDSAGYNEDGYDEDKCNRAGDRYCDECETAPCEGPSCDCCEEYTHESMTETLGGSDICESCRDSSYSYCDECEGYHHDEDSYEHQHSGDGCCDSPQPVFAVRNDGCEPLANDTRVTIGLPAGTISAEGLKAISAYLRDRGEYHPSRSLETLGDQWQTKGGNFAKRLSRMAYQTYRVKLSQDVLSQVGCIARDHSNAVDVEIEVSRELNQSAADWYHEDSCWWGSYYGGRCALKTNGGYGLRSFGDSGDVSGRAWILPLRRDLSGKLTPTFDTMTPDAFVVFNGYGDLSGYAAPRIVAHMAGWTYRKISFSAEPMYVNAGGYLVAPEDIAAKYTDGSLCLSISQHSGLYETERKRELVTC